MSCLNHHPNLTRKPRMSVRQVWKRKTPLPKLSPTRHNNSTPPPSRNTTHSISPPMNYPQRDQIIHQLYIVSSLIDSQTSIPSSPPHPMVQPPTNAQETDIQEKEQKESKSKHGMERTKSKVSQ
ncbi:hypothetical protein Tco_0023890, partial [Tanacetum coccineum]